MVEVLISGGGPAGASAALWLARRGVRVLVVDRARFPRSKLCGDTLGPAAVADLDQLGVTDAVTRAGLRLSGTLVEGQGVFLRTDYPRGTAGVALARRDLDAILLDAAGAAGARVQTGVRVVGPLFEDEGRRAAVRGAVLEVNGRLVRLPASVTIAADGRRSPLALALGLSHHPPSPRRWAIGGHFENVEGLEARGEIHLREGRYVGVAPLPGGLASAWIVSPADRAMRDPRALLEAVLASDPVLARRFGRAHLVAPVSSVGPLAVNTRGAGAPGLLLAGDAAGFVDPITGDGVRVAIRGGMLAADVALAMLEQPHLRGHVRLAQLRASEFGRKLRLHRLLRGLVGRSGRAGVTVARLAPALVRRLVLAAAQADLPSLRAGRGRGPS